jgi:Na+/H+-dicarboxylate symporter
VPAFLLLLFFFLFFFSPSKSQNAFGSATVLENGNNLCSELAKFGVCVFFVVVLLVVVIFASLCRCRCFCCFNSSSSFIQGRRRENQQ